MDLAYDNDSQGGIWFGVVIFCMFELIGRVVSETGDWAGESWYSFAGGQVTEVSLDLLCWQLASFVAIGLPFRGEGVQIEL